MAGKLVKLQAFLDRERHPEFTGRLLGLVTEEEFAGLVNKPEIRRQLFSVGSKPLKDLCDSGVDVENKRLVMTVKEKDDVEVLPQTLFITNPLEMISSIINDENINVEGKDQSYYIVEEVNDAKDAD